MNNTMCLGLFLMVVYARGLAWEFSAVLVFRTCIYEQSSFRLYVCARRGSSPVYLTYLNL
jgi:hypothetical protein